jgi:predicted Fe-Mo cluster-binding NifX family protein
MEIRIAVASSDGVAIDRHFGRAKQFRIYRLADAGFEFVEDRAVTPPCSGQQHSDANLADAAAVIADCQGVVALQIGPGAVDLLLGQRTLPFSMEGGVVEALQTLKESNRLKFLRKQTDA